MGHLSGQARRDWMDHLTGRAVARAKENKRVQRLIERDRSRANRDYVAGVGPLSANARLGRELHEQLERQVVDNGPDVKLSDGTMADIKTAITADPVAGRKLTKPRANQPRSRKATSSKAAPKAKSAAAKKTPAKPRAPRKASCPT